MLKEAILWEPAGDETARCNVCAYRCLIKNGKIGNCRTRKNIGGKIFSMIYGTVTSVASDPIEKKPLYHFYPGSHSYSVGSVGCSFHCEHCQNWTISQADIESVSTSDILPEQAVKNAVKTQCKSISWTYNEPSIWIEYTRDCADLCHQQDLKTIYVTNGYATPEHMDVMKGRLDAYRVDIKAFTDSFYRKVCKAKLAPVLESTVIARETGMHIEVVTLLIPGMNDSPDEVRNLSKWVFDKLGPDTPIHFTRFHPMYHMDELGPTPLQTLEKAHEIAKAEGLNYVYLGNTPGHKYESTWCPKCDELLIERYGFQIMRYSLPTDKKCPACGEKIPIVGDYGR